MAGSRLSVARPPVFESEDLFFFAFWGAENLDFLDVLAYVRRLFNSFQHPDSVSLCSRKLAKIIAIDEFPLKHTTTLLRKP